jgi:uncharacterized protein (TIGR00369 family)
VSRPRLPGAAFSASIGAVVEEVREGRVRIALVAGPRHLDAQGAVHTGVLTTMLDSAIGIGLGDLRRSEVRARPHATIEMNTSFPGRAGEGDEIVVEGRVTGMGGSIAFGEAEARRRGDGEVIAKARLTFAISGRPFRRKDVEG